MSRVPHVYLPPPWSGPLLELDDARLRHLTRVLRRSGGAAVSYTDGVGTVGLGTLRSTAVERGEEHHVAAPWPELTLAVAVPHRLERTRFLVEKLAELGVDRLRWVDTERGQGRVPAHDKATAWAAAALQQSRGAWLIRIDGPVAVSDLEPPVLLAEPGAGPLRLVATATTLLVGPEGGFTESERVAAASVFGLGSRIMRVETAAIAAGVLVLEKMGRLA